MGDVKEVSHGFVEFDDWLEEQVKRGLVSEEDIQKGVEDIKRAVVKQRFIDFSVWLQEQDFVDEEVMEFWEKGAQKFMEDKRLEE